MISSDWPAEYPGAADCYIVLPEPCACSSVCECMTLFKALKGNVWRHIAVLRVEVDKKKRKKKKMQKKKGFYF